MQQEIKRDSEAALVEQWRAETPGCHYRKHLNNAGAGLMPRAVIEAVQSHLEREAEFGGYEAHDAAMPALAATYEDTARLMGAKASNVAIVENATVAVAQALSAFDFKPGETIVTTRADYSSNQIMLLSLAQRLGVEVKRAADLPTGGADPDSVRELIRGTNCRLVLVTWIPTNSGLIQDAEAIGEVCDEEGVPYLIDACQVLGQLPVNVSRLRCDFLAATARKFLRGPRGIGFLYVSDRMLEQGRHPLYIDTRGGLWSDANTFQLAQDARRFENWEFAYALVLGLGAAARYALKVGIERGGGRALSLAKYAREQLASVDKVRVLDRGLEQAAIVTLSIDGLEPERLVTELRERGINTSASGRNYAVIDMDDKGVSSVLRISPHYYNTHDEIDSAVSALRSLIAKLGRSPKSPMLSGRKTT